MKKALITILILFMASPVLSSGKTISYIVDDEIYEGYYISTSQKAPLVILIHDWDGLTNYEIKRSKMLAELGYTVFAADLFGKGVRPTLIKDKRQHTGELYKDRNKMRLLLKGAIKTAEGLGADTENAVAMGYCFGGAAVLELARSGEKLKGFAVFHGGLSTPHGQDYSKTTGKIIVFHGTADKHIKMADFSELANELEKNRIHHEMITYGGAPHAFSVFDSKGYIKDADMKSWNRFINFLSKELKSK